MHENNESLGVYLKRSREEKNVSVEQVAYATRISLKMLRALEEDNHQTLPAPTFVRGYLQAYAKYVRIDTQDLLLRYQHHLAMSPDTKRNTIRSHYLYVRERYQEKRRLVLVIVLFATMLSVAGTYFLLKAKHDKRKRLSQATKEIQNGATTTSTNTIPPLLAAPTPQESKPEVKDAKDSKDAKDTKEVKPETKVATNTATATASETKTAAPTPPPAPAAPAAAPTPPPATPATTTADNSPMEAAGQDPNQKKTYNLVIKAEQDVWLRFQTDEDGIRDLTLRTGKSMMLRANSVIKIFSGNLGALKATMNGAPVATLASGNRSKSVVLPESEASKHPLPLFPQFQTKSGPERASVTPGNSTDQNAANGDSAQ